MAITRPCPDSDDPAAIALYLQALAFDAEAQLNSYSAALASQGAQGGLIQRITANTTFVAQAPTSHPIFLASPTTFDLAVAPDDSTGLWAYGFNVLTDPVGVKNANFFRHVDCRAGYTDSFGDFQQLSNVKDTEWESNSAALTSLNASGTFVMPQDQNIFPEIQLFFSYVNAGSNMEILAQSLLWMFRISSFNQVVISA